MNLASGVVLAVFSSISQPPPSVRGFLGDVPVQPMPVAWLSIGWIAVAPDGNSVVCSGHKGVRLFSFPDGQWLRAFEDPLDKGPTIVGFSADGKRVIGAGNGLRVWDAATGKVLVARKWESDGDKPLMTPRGVLQGGWPVKPAISPDGSRVYARGGERLIVVYDTATGKAVDKLPDLGTPPSSLSVSPDGKRLAVGTQASIQVWELGKKDRLSNALLPASHRGYGYRVTFSPDSKRVLVFGPSGAEVSSEEEFLVWDIAQDKFTLRVPALPQSGYLFDRAVVVGNGRYVLASQNASGYVGIYDLREGRSVGFAGRENGRTAPLILTPDGKHLLGGARHETMSIIKVEDVLKLIPQEKKP